ncbi:hypothetical protein EON68_01940 [archaeon]|nr:MAG: hypothetical protein EON68_01940 [archaeon]
MAARPRARSRSCTGGAAVVPSMGASPSGVTPSPSCSTAAVSAMELVTDAISSAIGTSVESVKIGSTTIACGPESASVTASPNPFPVTASSAASTASGLPSVGATSPDALALGASVEVVHTKAGDVVFGTAQVDFEAIAEAEAELSSARHTREAVGMDVLRAKGAKSGSRLPAAILASKAAINPAVTATYDVSSIESASEAPTLECVLFPWLV